MVNSWPHICPCREGPFQTSPSPLEDLQKVVVRASQGNGVSLWETSNLLRSLPNVDVDGQSPKVPLFPPVQSPEFHQVHLEVVV